MPKKNMSLDNRLTRYHRIGSPTDPARVERDRPLECALCHATKTVGELVSTMEAWWGRSYDRSALRALYGSLEANPLDATITVGKAHEQAVAVAVLGQSGDRQAVPLVAAQLTHPYPMLRYYAVAALAALTGQLPPVDLHQANDAIRAQAVRWLGGLGFALPATNATSGAVNDGDD
jgi:hypothetical protein